MAIQEKLTRWLDSGRYAQYGDRWDDKMFHEFVLERMTPTTHLLDLGAGAGIVPEMNFLEHAERVCGVDPDPRVIDNPQIHEGRIGFGEEIPYEDEPFDLVVCDNVLEHLANPDTVFREVRRVLKPGGRFMAKTPNFWHYVAISSALTPLSFHRRFNAGHGRNQQDTFPTCYRANSRRDLRKLAERTEMRLLACTMIEGRPEYLRRSWMAYLLGSAYERLVNSTRLFEAFRVVLIAEFERPE